MFRHSSAGVELDKKKAFELNPTAYWSAVLKAKIQLELKDNKGAIDTAEIAKKLAEADKDQAYVNQADEIIPRIMAEANTRSRLDRRRNGFKTRNKY